MFPLFQRMPRVARARTRQYGVPTGHRCRKAHGRGWIIATALILSPGLAFPQELADLQLTAPASPPSVTDTPRTLLPVEPVPVELPPPTPPPVDAPGTEAPSPAVLPGQTAIPDAPPTLDASEMETPSPAILPGGIATPPTLTPSIAVDPPAYAALGLPEPWMRPSLPTNPRLPESLLPDPLLPSPAVIPQAVCNGPFGCEGPPAACPPTRWVFRGGAVFLDRSDAFNQPLIAPPAANELIGNEQPLEFAAADFEFDMQAGPEIDLLFLSPLGWQAQLRHFGVASWNSHFDLFGADPAQVGRLLFGGPTASVLVGNPTLDYYTDLHSTELNYRKPVYSWLMASIGFRWIELEESYSVATVELEADDLRPSFLGYATYNHLYGLQFGADVTILDRGGPFKVDTSIRAGVYHNNADLWATRLSYLVPVEEEEDLSFRALRDEESHTSFLGEIRIGASWKVSRCLALRGGWNLLWIEGVALAPEQLATTALGDSREENSPAYARVNTEGSPFYHGPYLALELVW